MPMFRGLGKRIRNKSISFLPTPTPPAPVTFRTDEHKEKPHGASSPNTPSRQTLSQPINNDNAFNFRVEPEMILELRRQIQLRYLLDAQIWNDGKAARRFRQKKIKEKMDKSDAVLRNIKRKVNDWENQAFFSDEKSWQTFCEIKRRIDAEGKRDWATHPPWPEHREGELDRHGGGPDTFANGREYGYYGGNNMYGMKGMNGVNGNREYYRHS